MAEGLMEGIIVTLISGIIYFLVLYPNLKSYLILPSFIYCVLLSVVLWRGLIVLGSVSSATHKHFAAGIGAISYYISDLILSINLFAVKVPYGDYLIMITYYIAQLLLLLSVFI